MSPVEHRLWRAALTRIGVDSRQPNNREQLIQNQLPGGTIGAISMFTRFTRIRLPKKGSVAVLDCKDCVFFSPCRSADCQSIENRGLAGLVGASDVPAMPQDLEFTWLGSTLVAPFPPRLSGLTPVAHLP